MKRRTKASIGAVAFALAALIALLRAITGG